MHRNKRLPKRWDDFTEFGLSRTQSAAPLPEQQTMDLDRYELGAHVQQRREETTSTTQLVIFTGSDDVQLSLNSDVRLADALLPRDMGPVPGTSSTFMLLGKFVTTETEDLRMRRTDGEGVSGMLR